MLNHFSTSTQRGSYFKIFEYYNKEVYKVKQLKKHEKQLVRSPISINYRQLRELTSNTIFIIEISSDICKKSSQETRTTTHMHA